MFNIDHVQGIHGGDLLSIPNVVTTSAGMCDIDIRPVMYCVYTYVTIILEVTYRVCTVASLLWEGTLFFRGLQKG